MRCSEKQSLHYVWRLLRYKNLTRNNSPTHIHCALSSFICVPNSYFAIMLRIYKSSAGSGKTYTLVKEYLRLAFASTTKYKNILAITFTNKAAAEMKNRILEALEGISKGEEEYNLLKTELCQLTNKKKNSYSTMRALFSAICCITTAIFQLAPSIVLCTA